MSVPDYHDEPGAEQPFVSHLIELRDRLIRGLLAVLVAFVVLFPFSNAVYTYVAQPLMGQLPQGSSMIATEVAAPFLTPFRLALVAAVFAAMPYLLYQMWAFVAPGLYRHERRLAVPLVASSIALFYLGVAFAYYLVLPLVFRFLIGTTPEGVAVMTDISKYLDFVLTLFFAFGMAFEIPVATIILVVAGVVTPEGLAAKREYVIVGAFVIGAILTPPDVISQFMMAVPIWLLFELGLLFSRFLLRQRPRADDGATAAPPQGPGPTLLAPPTAPSATTAAPPSRPWSPPGEGLGDQLARQVLVGAEIDGGDMNLPGRFVPLTPEQMDAELDAIEGAESRADRGDPSESEDSQDLDHNDHPDLPLPAQPDPGESRLQRVQALRDAGDLAAARALLYEVLETGDADQRMVAHNILGQLDTL